MASSPVGPERSARGQSHTETGNPMTEVAVPMNTDRRMETHRCDPRALNIRTVSQTTVPQVGRGHGACMRHEQRSVACNSAPRRLLLDRRPSRALPHNQSSQPTHHPSPCSALYVCVSRPHGHARRKGGRGSDVANDDVCVIILCGGLSKRYRYGMTSMYPSWIHFIE